MSPWTRKRRSHKDPGSHPVQAPGTTATIEIKARVEAISTNSAAVLLGLLARDAVLEGNVELAETATPFCEAAAS